MDKKGKILMYNFPRKSTLNLTVMRERFGVNILKSPVCKENLVSKLLSVSFP